MLKYFTEEFERRAGLRTRRFAAYANQRIQEYLKPDNIEFTQVNLDLDVALDKDEAQAISVANYSLITQLINGLYTEYTNLGF